MQIVNLSDVQFNDSKTLLLFKGFKYACNFERLALDSELAINKDIKTKCIFSFSNIIKDNIVSFSNSKFINKENLVIKDVRKKVSDT